MLIRINLWSGPRNVSTALMYSFAQRTDTQVFDEPLYAHYLSKTAADTYHPGSKEILKSMENDGTKVIEMMRGKHTKPVVFFKQMTHHLVHLDWTFMLDMKNIILTRHPREMLPSFAEQIRTPTLQDVGYAAHAELVKYLQEHQLPIIVIDGKRLRQKPRAVLTKLCTLLDIPFDEKMLSWDAGARTEDGCWASYWYKSVHQSTGFLAPKPKTAPFPVHLMPLYEQCLPLYERLQKWAT